MGSPEPRTKARWGGDRDLPARLAAFLCQDAHTFAYDHGPNPTMTGFDTPFPSCPRHQAIAANLLAAPSPVTGEAELRAAARHLLSLHDDARESGDRVKWAKWTNALLKAAPTLLAALVVPARDARVVHRCADCGELGQYDYASWTLLGKDNTR